MAPEARVGNMIICC